MLFRIQNRIINQVISYGIRVGLIIFAIGSPMSISLAQIGFITALIFWGLKILLLPDVKIKGTFLDKYIFLYLLGVVISSAFGGDISHSLRLAKRLWIISMFHLIYNNCDWKFVSKLMKILLISSAVIGIYGIYQSLTGKDFFGNHIGYYGPNIFGAKGGFGLHLTFGGYQMMTALLLLSIIMYGFKKFNMKKKIAIITFTLIIIISVILSFARTAWFGFLGGVVLLVILGFFIGSRKQVIFIISLILAFFILSYTSVGVKKRIIRTYTDLQGSVRTEIWGAGIDMIRDKPILGMGLGGFSRNLETYCPDIMKVYRRTHTHNDFIGVYLRSGLIGFIGYMLIWVMFFIRMIKMAFIRFKDDRYHFAITVGLAAAILSFLIAGLGQNYFTDSENAMQLWFFMAFAMLLYKEQEQVLK